ncbi:MAG: NAD-dependent DNA ligase LigA [Lachnospiraceae bacterium]|nr:NAD-dependent DNA ligase LigA [Lachnospiraceae bacterium]
MNKVDRIKELVAKLNEARRMYYAEDREILSNLEYDKWYDELEALERETGITLANSPTQEVGYEAVEELPKEQHQSPMLSLDKTKDVEELRSFIGGQKALLSWKMDGLTIVLTYEGGTLTKAVTRGNGVIGEVVTNNARVFQNIPLQIPYEGRLVLRGEAIITYSDFEKINEEIESVDAKYKNPRNLCSGSVRQLNNQITRDRKVRFFAFALVQAEDVSFHNSRMCQMNWLREQGFDVVENREVTAETLDEAMDYFSEQIQHNDFPSDGLVALYDDIAYGDSLGTTAKFPRNAYAFKWADELKETVLRQIEWSPSRTGLINPVAIFDPVELEGTTVSRASVHNISIMKELALGVGDRIVVYKANMIIPQVAENLTESGVRDIPSVCPACQGATRISSVNDVETLYCTNPACPAKRMKSFTLFSSRDALNIDGLSEATLEKFMAHGFIHEFADLFRLDQHQEAIKNLDGFGEKSWNKLWDSIQNARHTTLSRLIYGLGIPNIGAANAKMICRYFQDDLEQIRSADVETLSAIDGIGEVIASSFTDFFGNEENNKSLEHLLEYLQIEKKAGQQEQSLQNKVFVITGSLEQFDNRSAMKEYIEARGGKVTGSVTKKTDYLINNDTASGSSKNKKAKELGVSIISEEDFLKLTEIR